MGQQKVMKVAIKKIEIPKEVYPRKKRPQEKDVEHLRGVEPFHKIVTANGGKTLVDGAHRLLAAKLDGKATVEVIDLGKISNDEILREAITRNAKHGKQLTLVEKQALSQRLVGDFTVSELCDMMGVPDRTMSRWLSDAKDERKEALTKKARKMLARKPKGKKAKKPSVTSVAKELGVARGTLQSWLAEPEEVAAEKKEKKAKAKEKAKAKTPPPPPTEETIDVAQLVEETAELVEVSAMGFIGECKANVKENDNPDGLHWSDFAKLVFVEVRKEFPKSA